MSENPPKTPKEENSGAKKGADDNALGNLLNRVSARTDEKRAQLSDQLQNEQEDRAQKERESNERRRQELLRKREKAIKKRQTQLMSPPKMEGTDRLSPATDTSQVPAPEFDLNVKNSKPKWVWVALLALTLGGGGAFALLSKAEKNQPVQKQVDSAIDEAPSTQAKEKPEQKTDEAAVVKNAGDTTSSAAVVEDASAPSPDAQEASTKTDAMNAPKTAVVKPAETKKIEKTKKKKRARRASAKKKSAKAAAEPEKKKGSIGLKRNYLRSTTR